MPHLRRIALLTVILIMAVTVSIPTAAQEVLSPTPPSIEQRLYMGTQDGPVRLPGVQSNIAPLGTYSTAAYPAWTLVTWSSYRDAGPMSQSNWEIYRAIGDGSNQTRVTNNIVEDTQPDYNRGATRVAFVSKRDGNYEIYAMNADGSGQTRLTNNPGDDLYPRWSPDGSKIAFYSKRDGNWEIYVMNADGSSLKRLTNNSANDITPAWSPDGTMIIFGSNRRSDGKWALWVMYADGTSLTQVTVPSYFAAYPAWSPDGTKIAYNDDDNRDGWYDLAVVSANGMGKYYPRGTSSPYREWFGAYWDPTGKYFANTTVEWTYVQNQGWYWSYAWIDRLDISNNAHSNIVINAMDWWVSWATTDIAVPVVRVTNLSRYAPTTSFAVPWVGADSGEAGLRRIDVQVRDGDSGSWNLAQSLDPSTPSLTYNGVDGHTYYFRARGIDNAWNTQPYTSNVNGDAVITVDTTAPQLLSLTAPALTGSRLVTVTWGAHDAQSGIASYSISVTLDAGAPITWLHHITDTSGTFTVPAGTTQTCFILSAQNGAGSSTTLSPVCTTVDDIPPTTTVTITQPITVPWFMVQWQAVDALSSIDSYDVQLRQNGGAWSPWLTSTQATNAIYRGEVGMSYAFRARASDTVGNLEPFHGEGISVSTPLMAIHGVIRDHRGEPVALARVEMQPPALDTATSSISGDYVFYLNTTGTYTVVATHTQYGNLPPLRDVVITGSTELPMLVLPPIDDVISNGQFEDGTLAHWLTSEGTSPIITTTAHTGDFAAHFSVMSALDNLRSHQAATNVSGMEQTVELSGKALATPTLSLLYHASSVQTGDAFYAIVITSTEPLTYTFSLENEGWQHAWIALPEINSPTVTVRLQVEQSEPLHDIAVIVDEVTIGSTAPPMHAVFLPLIISLD